MIRENWSGYWERTDSQSVAIELEGVPQQKLNVTGDPWLVSAYGYKLLDGIIGKPKLLDTYSWIFPAEKPEGQNVSKSQVK